MKSDLLRVREQFRLVGRKILRQPDDILLHNERVNLALLMDGSEPLQGALSDMIYACLPNNDLIKIVSLSSIRERLSFLVFKKIIDSCRSDNGLQKVTSLATRWSILVTPSLDVPARAILCGVDDSRSIVREVISSLLAGDDFVEETFLVHCREANDTLAFMLARRAMMCEGRTLSVRWIETMKELQRRVIK